MNSSLFDFEVYALLTRNQYTTYWCKSMAVNFLPELLISVSQVWIEKRDEFLNLDSKKGIVPYFYRPSLDSKRDTSK